MNERPEKRIKKIEDEKKMIIRYADPVMHWNEDVVDINYDIIILNKDDYKASQIQEMHRMRFFFRPEIEMILKQAGFSIITCVDCNTLEEPNGSSWTVYYLARKNGK